jgi:hypothetical protein
MSKITTEDCKEYLVKAYKDKGATTQEKDWKRTKKHKNEDGLWVRDFNHAGIGNISLLESATGLLSIIDSTQNKTLSTPVSNSTATHSFDLTVFSDSEIKKAWSTYKKYYEPENDQDDDFVILHDKSIRAIPSILSWYIAPDAYENYELENKKITWDFNMKGYNVYMFDHENHHEYGGDEHLLRKYLPKYFSKMDEYHYEILTDVTVEQLVRDLSIFGYSHVNEHYDEDCVLKKLMKKVSFNKIPFVVSQLEKDILAGNVKKYTIADLNSQKVNGQSAAIFAINNSQYDVFNYLVENKVDITKEEISLVISNDYLGLYNDNDKTNSIMKVLFEYEDITLDKESLGKVTHFLQHSNRDELLLGLLPKYGTEDNILLFVTHPNISTHIDVLPTLINRFAQKDEELKSWIESEFIYDSNFILLDNKAVRDALTRAYIVSILDEHHNARLESLRYEAERSRGGMMVIETYRDGTSQSWLNQRSQSVAQFIQIKNKIISYFDKNDDENKPKYRTKF